MFTSVPDTWRAPDRAGYDPTSGRTVARVLPMLADERIVWLSTVRPDGTPHLVPTWFWWDGTALVVFSKPDAVKARNLRANPRLMVAVGDPGSFQQLPDMYMRKMAVGPKARGSIDLKKPVGDNIRAIADAFGRMVNDVTTIVLDRPRHHDLIEEIRAAGARIKLIQDGDVTASISAAIRGTNDHLAIGIGGTRQAVLTAAALRCLGGELQAQLWPTSRSEVEAAHQAGVEDLERLFTIEDLASGEVIVVATGVSNGDLLRGVRFLADSARTHSLVMCTRCNWVRFVDGIHFFARERREEVRLLGY